MKEYINENVLQSIKSNRNWIGIVCYHKLLREEIKFFARYFCHHGRCYLTKNIYPETLIYHETLKCLSKYNGEKQKTEFINQAIEKKLNDKIENI